MKNMLQCLKVIFKCNDWHQSFWVLLCWCIKLRLKLLYSYTIYIVLTNRIAIRSVKVHEVTRCKQALRKGPWSTKWARTATWIWDKVQSENLSKGANVHPTPTPTACSTNPAFYLTKGVWTMHHGCIFALIIHTSDLEKALEMVLSMFRALKLSIKV